MKTLENFKILVNYKIASILWLYQVQKCLKILLHSKVLKKIVQCKEFENTVLWQILIFCHSANFVRLWNFFYLWHFYRIWEFFKFWNILKFVKFRNTATHCLEMYHLFRFGKLAGRARNFNKFGEFDFFFFLTF